MAHYTKGYIHHTFCPTDEMNAISVLLINPLTHALEFSYEPYTLDEVKEWVDKAVTTANELYHCNEIVTDIAVDESGTIFFKHCGECAVEEEIINTIIERYKKGHITLAETNPIGLE